MEAIYRGEELPCHLPLWAGVPWVIVWEHCLLLQVVVSNKWQNVKQRSGLPGSGVAWDMVAIKIDLPFTLGFPFHPCCSSTCQIPLPSSLYLEYVPPSCFPLHCGDFSLWRSYILHHLKFLYYQNKWPISVWIHLFNEVLCGAKSDARFCGTWRARKGQVAHNSL